jgi:GNAT superfamily N-acetyltransferase
MKETYSGPLYILEAPRPQDAQGLGELAASIWLDNHSGEQAGGLQLGTQLEWDRLCSPMHQADTVQDISSYAHAQATAPGEALWRVARTADGAVIGSVQGRGTGIATELLDIQVDPDFHGEGVTQDLVGALFDWAAETHPGKPIYVSVDSRNGRAVGFYEKLDFRPVTGAGLQGGSILRLVRDTQGDA